jgi:hypothetical protein
VTRERTRTHSMTTISQPPTSSPREAIPEDGVDQLKKSERRKPLDGGMRIDARELGVGEVFVESSRVRVVESVADELRTMRLKRRSRETVRAEASIRSGSRGSVCGGNRFESSTRSISSLEDFSRSTH